MKVTGENWEVEIDLPQGDESLVRIGCQLVLDRIEDERRIIRGYYEEQIIDEAEHEAKQELLDQLESAAWNKLADVMPTIEWSEV